jgi:hypothetical protein
MYIYTYIYDILPQTRNFKGQNWSVVFSEFPEANASNCVSWKFDGFLGNITELDPMDPMGLISVNYGEYWGIY